MLIPFSSSLELSEVVLWIKLIFLMFRHVTFPAFTRILVFESFQLKDILCFGKKIEDWINDDREFLMNI